MRRIPIVILFSLPALVLGGWLLSEQLPVLVAPQWWWISANSPQGAPAACEAATSLRLYNGERVLFEQPTISSDEAKAAADSFIAEQYSKAGEDGTAVTSLEYGGPSLFRATLNGERRLVWLYTARVETSHIANMPGTEMPGMAAIIYMDANTGESLALLSAAGAGNAPAMCPFPVRDWAVVAVRGTPFLALTGYVGLLVFLGVVVIIYRIVRRRRTQPQERAHG
jgi:hypothetical protein